MTLVFTASEALDGFTFANQIKAEPAGQCETQLLKEHKNGLEYTFTLTAKTANTECTVSVKKDGITDRSHGKAVEQDATFKWTFGTVTDFFFFKPEKKLSQALRRNVAANGILVTSSIVCFRFSIKAP